MASVSLPPIPDDKFVFTPQDAAQILGIDPGSVTRHLKIRPALFPRPRKVGKRRTTHEWSREQFEDVLKKLVSLSDKARVFLAAASPKPAMAV